MPPKRKPKAIPHERAVIDFEKRKMPAIAKKDKRESKTVALCTKPKAAPELAVNCNCRKEPRIGFGSLPKVCRASAFEPLSIAMIAMATASKDLTALR